MLAYRTRPAINSDLVGRIDSEHLSEQFQRELSNSPGDDLLQDELKLDDISNASGPCHAALCYAQSLHVYMQSGTYVQEAVLLHLHRQRSLSRSQGLIF